MFEYNLLQVFPLRTAHVRVVSKSKSPSRWEYGREEGFRPWLGRILASPSRIAIVRYSVDENNTGRES